MSRSKSPADRRNVIVAAAVGLVALVAMLGTCERGETTTSSPSTLTETVTATALPSTVTVTVTTERVVVAAPPPVIEQPAPPTAQQPEEPPPPVMLVPQGTDSVYYGSCAQARSARAAPLYAGQPGYRAGLDRDSDGVACE